MSQSNSLCGDMSFSADYFHEHGFMKVESFISREMIAYLKGLIDATDGGTTFDTIRKNTYNVGIDDINIKKLVHDKSFGSMIYEVGYKDSFLSDGIVFETDSEKTGFDWHLDITSFKYIMPEDRAFSIWIALDPIDNMGQGGGLTMLSQDIFSGKEFFKLQSKVTRSISEKRYSIDDNYKTLLGPKYRNEEQKQLKKLFPFIQEKFPHLFSDSLYISGFSRNLFDKEGVVFDLNAGDAIIFDKTIFHRSNPLLPGMMKTRKAFVLRFIQADSTYNVVNAKLAGGDNAILVDKMVSDVTGGFCLDEALLVRAVRC